MIDIQELLKGAQAMQGQMKNDLQKLRVQATSGGEAVTVTLNGNKELTSIEIQPSALSDAELLEDLILSAMNSGYAKVDQQVQNQFGQMLNGLDLSNLGNLFKQ